MAFATWQINHRYRLHVRLALDIHYGKEDFYWFWRRWTQSTQMRRLRPASSVVHGPSNVEISGRRLVHSSDSGREIRVGRRRTQKTVGRQFLGSGAGRAPILSVMVCCVTCCTPSNWVTLNRVKRATLRWGFTAKLPSLFSMHKYTAPNISYYQILPILLLPRVGCQHCHLQSSSFKIPRWSSLW